MDHPVKPSLKFQRNTKKFNSVEYMRKSKTILNSIRNPESLTRQKTALQSRHRATITISNLFLTEPSPQKRKKSKKLSILSEFGLLPERSLHQDYTKRLPGTCKNSINIPDFLGRKNRQQLFQSLDLNKEVSKKDKFQSFDSYASPTNKFPIAINEKIADVCRNTGCSNGYQNIEKYFEKLEKIDQIYKSCDILLKESKFVTKNLKSYIKFK